MKKLFLLTTLIVAFWGCQPPIRNKEVKVESLETPPSYLGFRINLPVSELQDGINKVLPGILVDDKIPLKGKDTLFLKIKRSDKLNLAVRKRTVYLSISLEVEAAVKKRVLGVTISNLDNPLQFSGTLKSSTDISLQEDWQMGTQCKYLGFDLEEARDVSILGLKINIDKSINKLLDNHEEELSDVICMAMDQAFDLKRSLNKIWYDLQDPIRIAKNPKKLFLNATPTQLNAELIPKSKDTLSVHVEYKGLIEITPEFISKSKKITLPNLDKPFNKKPALVAYPKVIVPYEELSSQLQKELANQQFEYEGYRIKIEGVKVKRSNQGLTFEISTKGDINGTILASGLPGLNDDQELIFTDFKYDIDSDDDWIKMADWTVHQFAEEYLEKKIKMDIRPFFEDLHIKIMDGLSKSRLKDKLGVNIEFVQIESYQMGLTDTAIEWIFYMEGKATLTLKSGLFKKKK